MRISIAERLRPFCHVPGTSTILPGWGYQVQVYPCLIRIAHLKHNKPSPLAELKLNLKGPIQQFTLFNDLEKGRITVSGRTLEGWMRYHLISARQEEGLRLFVEKAPANGFPIENNERQQLLHDKEWIDVLKQSSYFEPYQVPTSDRLSLGNHRAQDWELIRRRFNLTEILPLVHRLGQLIPSFEAPSSQDGTLSLLENCKQSFIDRRPEKGEEAWHCFLMGCFNSLLVPQLEDANYQGFVDVKSFVLQDISPLVLLSEGARLLRELFVQQEKDQIAILPYLLPSLHCGRLLNVSLEDGGWLSLEWTKKSIRRLILYAGSDSEYRIKFRSDVKSYRLRQHDKEKGERVNCYNPLLLKKNCYYLFDNFQ